MMTIYELLREAYRDLERAEARVDRLRDQGKDTREADRHVQSYRISVRSLERQRDARERAL